ncbi:glycosyltransferase [Tomitella gaofuii]|uniref:glycosyltransferase n=1 Tax=Tomitella gaofuii TaxID=2760083 RepID=UPI0015F95A09|nr:glycosyltransferase [Tomitella gaofuii]
MKIAMVSEHADPTAAMGGVDVGGQNVHVADLSAALVELGNDVTVYTRRSGTERDDCALTGAGYRVVQVPAGPPHHVPRDELLPLMGEFGDHLEKLWRVDRPEVVHAHFWMSGLVSTLLGRAQGLPVVQTFHALGVVKRRHLGAADPSPRPRVALERMIARRADRVCATCSDEVRELVGMGVRRDRVSVVPCGVDIGAFDAAAQDGDRGAPTDRSARAYGEVLVDGLGTVSEARRRIVAVGRLVPRKGFETVIRALPALPRTELVIAGGPAGGSVDGDEEARRLMALAYRLGVGDRVLMPGQVPHAAMPSLLRSADVVVCTPWYEPFGIVPLEAMACARPVIASAVGGLTDTVVDGVTGLHVPPRDPQSLTRALRLLLDDPMRREGYGQSGLQRVRSRYSWARVAADTAQIYDGCLRSRSSRTPAAEAAR